MTNIDLPIQLYLDSGSVSRTRRVSRSVPTVRPSSAEVLSTNDGVDEVEKITHNLPNTTPQASRDEIVIAQTPYYSLSPSSATSQTHIGIESNTGSLQSNVLGESNDTLITAPKIHKLSVSDKFSDLLKWKRPKLKSSITSFSIHLDEGKTIYLPGQRVEGVISAIFNRPTAVKMIKVKLSGSITASQSYSDAALPPRAILFKDVLTVFGVPNSDNLQTLNNEHVFPFNFQIPLSSLPPTYKSAVKHSYAEVRYEISAVLIRPRHSNRFANNQITIPSTLDPSDSEFDQKVEMEAKIKIGKLWYSRGHLDLNFCIPRGAYTSEQVVPIQVSIKNQASCQVSIKTLFLKQEIAFGNQDSSDKSITERMHYYKYNENFNSDARHVQREIHFPIPPATVISPSINTSLLKVQHYLGIKVSWVDGRLKGKKTFQIPFVIAGYPYLMLDVIGDRVSLDTLPVYEHSSQETNLENVDGDVLDFIDFEDSYVSPVIISVPRRENKIKVMMRKVKMRLGPKSRDLVS